MKKYIFRHCLMICLFFAIQDLRGAMPPGAVAAKSPTAGAKPIKPVKSEAIKETAKKLAIENSNAQRQAANLPPLPETTVIKKFEAAERAKKLNLNGKTATTSQVQEIDLSALSTKPVKKSGFSLQKPRQKKDITSNSKSSEPSLNMNINTLAKKTPPAKPEGKDRAMENIIARENTKAKIEANYQARTHNVKVRAQNTALSNKADTELAQTAPKQESVNLGSGKSFLTGLKELDIFSFLTSNTKTEGTKTSAANGVNAEGTGIKTPTQKRFDETRTRRAKEQKAIATLKKIRENAKAETAQAQTTKAKLAEAQEAQANKELQDAMSPSLTQAAGRGAQYLANSAASGARYLRDGAVALGNSTATSASNAAGRVKQAFSSKPGNDSTSQTLTNPLNTTTANS